MAVPKKRTSASKRNMRRSHHALAPTYVFECPRCFEKMRPHRACSGCGYYRGKLVAPPKGSAVAE